MYWLRCSLSESLAQKRQPATTKAKAITAKQIAVGSKLKKGMAIFVITVNMGENTRIAKELPFSHTVLYIISSAELVN